MTDLQKLQILSIDTVNIEMVCLAEFQVNIDSVG